MKPGSATADALGPQLVPEPDAIIRSSVRTFRRVDQKKTPKTSFGQRLYALRTQRGFTQMELAKALGTTQRVISYYETKGELPPPDFLVELVRSLGASADELLGLKPSKVEQRKEDPKRRRLWKRFRKMASLPERDQRAVIRLINSLAGSKTQERASA
jgi:transcriptional regulator with XRE-family HTH domain